MKKVLLIFLVVVKMAAAQTAVEPMVGYQFSQNSQPYRFSQFKTGVQLSFQNDALYSVFFRRCSIFR